MTHSPAPWRAPRGSASIFDANGARIATLHSQKGIRPHLTEDGPLIAAAPDLLRLAKTLMDAHPAFRSMPIGAPGSTARAEQDAAIAAENELRAIIASVEGAR